MNKKRLFIWVGATLVLVAALITGLVVYSFRSFARTPILTKSQKDDIETALKGTAGELMFGELRPVDGPVSAGTGLDALFATQKQVTRREGLIAAYQSNPGRFRHYAQLFDTVANAKRVAEVAQANERAYIFPISSADLPLQSIEKLDPWDHPFCVSEFKGMLVVVSGGPKAITFSCALQHLSRRQVSTATRKVFQTPDEEVVLIVRADGLAQETTKRPTAN